ncbi:sarcalumenin-like [Megalops cyprinoides]|uniref:sarcalumenin-like n=1 Tax=Megalops cyprinoides TaxID=118141 RepID=UPI0018652FFE|nr:sarcalumenin-like [Megalops cyprinoides]
MAERGDGTLFDLERSSMASRVVEIIGGIGHIQTLQDAVEAAVAALEGDSVFHCGGDVWLTRSVSVEDSGAPEPLWEPAGGSAEEQAEDVGLEEGATSAAGDLNPAQLETDSGVDGEDVDVTAVADENEIVPSEDINTPPDEENSQPQSDPLTEAPENSAQDPVEQAVETSEEPLSAVPDENPTEPHTQPEPEIHTMEGSEQEEMVTSPEQTAEEATSDVTPEPVLTEEAGQTDEAGEPAGEGSGQEDLSESQNEAEEEEENEEEKELSKMDGGQEENSPQGTLPSLGLSPCSSSQSSTEVPHSGSRKKPVGRNAPSKYNTVSYRTIRKGNTRQRIDEFEAMTHS